MEASALGRALTSPLAVPVGMGPGGESNADSVCVCVCVGNFAPSPIAFERALCNCKKNIDDTKLSFRAAHGTWPREGIAAAAGGTGVEFGLGKLHCAASRVVPRMNI